jgi:serine/threonine-protein kinase
MGVDDATTVSGRPDPDRPATPRPSGSELIGSVFDGRYTILREIAAGSMGVLYEAEQISLGRRVAVKLLRPDRARREVFHERFMREARAAAAITHPNIVEILDVAQAPKGPLYMVMEYLEGLDLRHLLHREKQMPWWRARPILVQLASALAAVHRAGIIHRDIKPSNCFLIGETGRETVKLIDFGVIKYGDAKMESRALTQADDVVGTVVYMAPEQCRGEPATARTDVYSLGVVAYQMVTGRLPFIGRDIFDVMAAHQRLTPPTPRTLVAGLPESAEAIILRAIAKDPAERYESMEEFEAALRSTRQPLPMGDDRDDFGEDAPTLIRPDPEDAIERQETVVEPPRPRLSTVEGSIPTAVPRGATVRVPVVAPEPVRPTAAAQTLRVAPAPLRRQSNKILELVAIALVVLAVIVIAVVVTLGLQTP